MVCGLPCEVRIIKKCKSNKSTSQMSDLRMLFRSSGETKDEAMKDEGTNSGVAFISPVGFIIHAPQAQDTKRRM